MNISEYKEDTKKQESGSPCYLGDACFYVKRVGSKSYLKEIDQIKRDLYGFDFSQVDNGEVVAHWLAECGVTNWEGVLDEDDSKLEYSKSNARRVFLNKSYFLSLNALLINHGTDYSNYLYDLVTEDVGEVKKN